MSKPTRIGEIEIAGTRLPVFASAVLVDRVLRVDPGYTGDDDGADRIARLLDAATISLCAGKNEFGHLIRDRGWKGDPEKIESERVNIAASFGPRCLLLAFAGRKIPKRDPRYAEIASAALKTMQTYEARRDV